MNSVAASFSSKSKIFKSCQLLIHVICLFANCRVPKIDFSKWKIIEMNTIMEKTTQTEYSNIIYERANE